MYIRKRVARRKGITGQKIKVVSDGTTFGTRVMYSDGSLVPHVRKVSWVAEAGQQLVDIKVEFNQVPLEAEGKIKE